VGTQYLRVKGWEEFQHYTNRLPPWIKLHRGLLTNYDFCHLPGETKGHLLMTWLLASQMDGRIPDDAVWIAGRIGANEPVNLDLLIRGGWLIREEPASKPLARRKRTASTTLADCKQNAIVETETYKPITEAETEKPLARELADWIPKPAWKEFVVYRKQQKGWTAKAEVLLLRELEKLHVAGNDATLVIEQSIANGWKGLFPLRSTVSGRPVSLAEVRSANINAIGRTHGASIDGIAERVDQAAVPALSVDLREQGTDDVRRSRSG